MPNAGQITNRTVPLVKYLRAHGHAQTPIILAEGSPVDGWLLNASAPGSDTAKNGALKLQYV